MIAEINGYFFQWQSLAVLWQVPSYTSLCAKTPHNHTLGFCLTHR